MLVVVSRHASSIHLIPSFTSQLSCGILPHVRRGKSSVPAGSLSDEDSFISFTLIGPPGSGKGTYGSLVSQRLGVQFLSMGDILRRHVKDKTDIGKAVQQYKHKGKLVPDDIVISALRQEELSWWRNTKEREHQQHTEPSNNSKLGFILDGFPRTVAQAKLISPHVSVSSPVSKLVRNDNSSMPFRIHFAIHIDVPLEICLKKIMGRRTCSKCGLSINTCDIRPEIDNGFSMPPMLPPTTAGSQKHCCPDQCSKHWLQRADDTQEDIVKHRLDVYYAETSPVLHYYHSMGGHLLTFKPYNGLKDVDLLTRYICDAAS